MMKRRNLWVIVLCVLCAAGGRTSEAAGYPRVVESSDGVPISYQVQGEGAVALVFVHGWSCDSRYWQNQIEPFSRQFKVITLDLAGHGHSGMSRPEHTLQAFGEDVKAVVQDQAADRVILVGHSMSGHIIAEAARVLPGKVLALVAVDTLENVEMPFSEEDANKMAAPMEKDFRKGVQAFVASMFPEQSDPAIKKWVVDDMSSAPKAIALNAFQHYIGMYVRGEAASVFEGLDVPVYGINAPAWPTDVEANRRHMKSFDYLLIEGTGHFPMLEKPEEFNALLRQTLESILPPGG